VARLNDRGEVRVAGGVVLRLNGEDVEVLMIYRRAFDDWSLPKGKVKRAEEDADGALREVLEETGLHCELLGEIGAMRYQDNRGVAKAVRYWAMTVRSGEFAPTSEVDGCRWLNLPVAAMTATRSGDREFLVRVVERSPVRVAEGKLVFGGAGYIEVQETG
jgi:8-oxo-dGTP diphosphatase